MMSPVLIQGVILVTSLATCLSLRCFECNSMLEPTDCGTITECPDDSSCFLESYITTGGITQYNIGCRSTQKCQSKQSSSKRTVLWGDVESDSKRSDLIVCEKCCARDFCNQQGCNFIGKPRSQRGPYCFECKAQSDLDTCRTVILCDLQQQCSKLHAVVPGTSSPDVAFIGKRTSTLPICCDTDFCNDHRRHFNVTSIHQTNVDGHWSVWSNWSGCSETCGLTSKQHRTRSCANPTPQGNGTKCIGHGFEERQCSVVPCPVDGNWSVWGAWSSCSPTCGSERKRHRSKTCDNPAPRFNGTDCRGNGFQETDCVYLPCPVDGNWSAWSAWSYCSKTCGTASTKYRMRTCDNPAPRFNGNNCTDRGNQEMNCTEVPCPVDGSWSMWSQWSQCSPSCGSGRKQHRTRSCDNPTPTYSGSNCTGKHFEKQYCADVTCQVNGAWSDWGEWSTCTVTCGSTGMHIRNRACDKPPPQHNGTDCQGIRTEVKACPGLKSCQVDGQWSAWTAWTSCTVTCGLKGQRLRTRVCDDPAPQNNGKVCPGDNLEVDVCAQRGCPVDGQWSSWGLWSGCSATCSMPAETVRTRTCDNPPPQNYGKNCTGESKEIQHCDIHPCSVGGHWAPWSKWSSCTFTCGPLALKLRARQCINTLNGPTCIGSDRETEQCSVPDC